jgi:hypothetical protein
MKRSVSSRICWAITVLAIMPWISGQPVKPAASQPADKLITEIQQVAGNNRTILTATIASASPGEPFHLVQFKDINVLRGNAPTPGTTFNVASGNYGFAKPYPLPRVGQKAILVIDNPAPPQGRGQVMLMMAQIMVVHLLLDATEENLEAAKAAAAEKPLNEPGIELGNPPKQPARKITVDPTRGVVTMENEH